MANQLRFRGLEAYLSPLNTFIEANEPALQSFFAAIVVRGATPRKRRRVRAPALTRAGPPCCTAPCSRIQATPPQTVSWPVLTPIAMVEESASRVATMITMSLDRVSLVLQELFRTEVRSHTVCARVFERSSAYGSVVSMPCAPGADRPTSTAALTTC